MSGTLRHVVEATRGERSTFVKLSCGHERSWGGHVAPNGTVICDPKHVINWGVACADGHCGGRP